VAWKLKPSLWSINKPLYYMCTIHRMNYCCWKPCSGKIVIMNVCWFVSWGDRHNEILLPLLRVTRVRLCSLFSSDPLTMESSVLDRITLDVNDCCAACRLESALTSLSSLSCFLIWYLYELFLLDTFYPFSLQMGMDVVIVCALCSFSAY
jgi:hypothetical protein